MLVAGDLVYPGAMAPEVLARYAGWVADLPGAMTSCVVLANPAARLPLPPPLDDSPAVVVRVWFDGSADVAEALIGSWRRWSEPALDRVHPRAVAEVAQTAGTAADRRGHVVTTDRLTGLTDDVIHILCDAVLPAEVPPLLLRAELCPLPGRSDVTGHRRPDLLLQLVGDGPTPEAAAAARRRLAGLRLALADAGAATTEPLRG